ncbi:patatin-like phospholipase family protein [Legionella hackeliae]|uniref:Patatin n=1 Tax=Legionella hackeliae TaxID=449 RepID=A0A0A8UPB2_LEGHA|nr:patatin-like phospholipase family protein [Legionella hackeliae]KTD13872.1 esterase [Legionella hackeliae]CEK10573.1 Patatin [Legionella hackeliae]STX47313.1 esterase [Legionella hackeliae]
MPKPPKSLLSHKKPVLIDLALQGGGAHGAYTWGVLDRLLEEPKLRIEGISGTSAGSMNAAVLASAYLSQGPEGARAALEAFWQRVSEAGRFSLFHRSFWDILAGNWTLDNSPLFMGFDLASRIFSPYDLNPAAFNPLKEILNQSINFDELAKTPIKLFITATNVRTGRGRVFRNHEITSEVLLASACLPTLFQAIEIDGEAYWDGGYTGNPTITPLVKECLSSDTILVQINPVERAGTPRTAREILNRLNEVSFNSSLMKELRMIAILKQVGGVVKGEGERWAKMRIHRITSNKMVELGYSSKLNAEWSFFSMLRDEGRAMAESFLIKHGSDLNRRSSFDLDTLL